MKVNDGINLEYSEKDKTEANSQEAQELSLHGLFNVPSIQTSLGDGYRVVYATPERTEIVTIRGNTRVDDCVFENHALSKLATERQMFSYTITSYPLSKADQLPGLSRNVKLEVAKVASKHNAQLVYVVAHKTGIHPLLVSVGGDCYRLDRGDLLSILNRVSDLAVGMLRKSALIFPHVPALTGGKKGEFGIIDENLNSIAHLFSDEAIYQLSSQILPVGINFLNEKKTTAFPEAKGMLRPDSLSPDVFTGARWREYTASWLGSGIDPWSITCLPNDANLSSSAIPTAFGVVATTATLCESLDHGCLQNQKLLIEGFGGVGYNVTKILLNDYHVTPDSITIVDPRPEACKEAADLGVNFLLGEGNEVYTSIADEHYDVWLNCGLGDQVGISQVESLLACGVKVFAGGANNLFRVSELEEVLKAISDQKAMAFPDFATSGGGWTMAVLGQVAKVVPGSLGETDPFQIISKRNTQLVKETIQRYRPGMDGWKVAEDVMNVTINRVLNQHQNLILSDFDPNNWNF